MSYTVTPNDLRRYAISGSALTGYEDDELQGFLDVALSQAYSYLRSQYTLPLSAAGLDLTMAVCQLAAFRALTHRGFDPSNPADQVLVKAHDDAIAWLRDVANGRASIDVTSTSPAKTSSGARVYSGRSTRGW